MPLGLPLGLPWKQIFPASWVPSNATSQALVQHLDVMQTDASPWWKDKAHTGDDRILNGGPGLQRGQQLDFDGTDDYVSLGSGSHWNLSTGSYSVCIRFNADSVSGNQYLWDKQQAGVKGYYGKWNSGLIIGQGDGTSWNETNTGWSPSTGTDQAMVLTWDADKLRLYVNGTLNYTSASLGITPIDSTSALAIASATASKFNGRVWDVRFFNKALSADEVTFVNSFGASGTDPTLTNCVGWYKLDEQSGTTAYDCSGNGRDGTLTNFAGSPWTTQDVKSWQNDVGYYLSGSVFVPRDESNTTQDVLGNTLTYSGSAPRHGKIVDSNSVDLNGSTQYGTVPAEATWNLGQTDAFSISLRVRFDALGTTQMLLSSYDGTDGWQLYTTSSTGFTLWSGSGVTNTVTALSNDTWYHIVITRPDSDTAPTMYVDGVSEGQFSGNLDFNHDSNALGFGANTNGTSPLNGKLCDVRIWGKELSAAEVKFLAGVSGGTDPGTTDLTKWWPLAEGSGTEFHNVMSNSSHGTWVNSPTLTFDQDVFAYNVTMGCTVAGAVLVPALADGSTDADGNSIGVPSGGFDDRCESNLDHDPYTCPLLAPGNLNSYDMNTDYSSAYRMKIDDLTSVDQHFAKRATSTPSRNDEHILFAGDLSGDDWDNMHVYVDTRAQLNGRLEHVWPFNVITLGSPNTFLDEVGSLTLSDSDDNAVTGLAGKLGNCIEMTLTGGSLADSVGLDATAPAGLNTNLPVTHYGWIKVGNLSTADDIRIFDQNTSSQKLEVTAANGYLKWTYNGSTITGSAVGDGNWYFFVAARDDDGNLTLWIDGVRQGIQAGVSMPTGTGTILHYEDGDDVGGQYPQHFWDAWGATGTYKLRDNHVSFLHNLGSGRALNTTTNVYDA